jgi:glycosidase
MKCSKISMTSVQTFIAEDLDRLMSYYIENIDLRERNASLIKKVEYLESCHADLNQIIFEMKNHTARLTAIINEQKKEINFFNSFHDYPSFDTFTLSNE